MSRDRLIQIVALVLLLGGTGASGALLPRITDLSRQHAMRYTDVAVEGAPPVVAIGQMIGALRGIIVDVLWIKVNAMKQKGLYYEIMADSEMITKLQPRYAAVWAFHGHNMAYNVSVAHNTAEERWSWVQKGIDLVRNQGLRYNPNDLVLHRELAFWFAHKIEGVADDAHFHYKTQLAREWHDVLGEPPFDYEARIAWIKEIADGPATLDEAERRTPGVKAIVESLRKQLSPYEARFRFDLDRRFLREVARRQALTSTSIDMASVKLLGLDKIMAAKDEELAAELPASLDTERRIYQVLDAVATDPATAEAWTTLIAHVRKRVLLDQFNMDPRLMYQLTRDYGPVDWRHGQAHALYWAVKGTEHGEVRVEVNEEDVYRIVNNDRTKLQAMQGLARWGRISFDPYGSEMPARLPDPRWIASVDKYWNDLSVKHAGTRGPGVDLFIAFHRNFLSSAVRELYRSGEHGLAQRYLDRLNSLYGLGAPRGLADPTFAQPLELFVREQTKVDYTAEPHTAATDVASALRYAFLVGVGDNRPEVYDQAMQFINWVINLYKQSEFVEFQTKMGNSRLGDMVTELEQIAPMVLAQVLVDTSVPLLKRLVIYNRVDVSLKQQVYDDVFEPLRQQFLNNRLSSVLKFKEEGGVFPEPPGMDAYRIRRAEQQLRQRERDGEKSLIERRN